jgi:hypothetical protein
MKFFSQNIIIQILLSFALIFALPDRPSQTQATFLQNLLGKRPTRSHPY